MIAELRGFDSAVWIRALGRFVNSIAYFIARPFLVLYLYDQMNVSLMVAALVLAVSPLTQFAFGFLSGYLTDRYGRVTLMFWAQIIMATSFFGYVFSTSPWHFALFTVVNGIGGIMFGPASNAHIADSVPEEKRLQVYSFLQTAFNLGTAIGPMLGVWLYTFNPSLVFTISGVLQLIVGVILLLFLPETLPKEKQVSGKREKQVKQKLEPLKLREHKMLVYMTLLSVTAILLYGQIETMLPLHLKDHFVNYAEVFALMMTTNAVVVICLQMWVSKRTEKMKLANLLLFSYVLFAMVSIGYGVASSLALLLIMELLFTIGEMICFPHLNKAVAQLAPEEFRGRYFAIYGQQWPLGRMLAPLIGGAIMSVWDGTVLFFSLSVVLLISGLIWYKFLTPVTKKTEIEQQASL